MCRIDALLLSWEQLPMVPAAVHSLAELQEICQSVGKLMGAMYDGAVCGYCTLLYQWHMPCPERHWHEYFAPDSCILSRIVRPAYML